LSRWDKLNLLTGVVFLLIYILDFLCYQFQRIRVANDFLKRQEKDVEGSRDHPLLTRMENFYISGYEELDYESHDFYDEEDNEYIIEGHKWAIEYTLKEGVRLPGQLKVRRNYANAIKMIGGVILDKQGRYMKVTKDGKESWIDVWVDDDGCC
jgi:hypothetical protein